jgi:hypothetical protein
LNCYCFLIAEAVGDRQDVIYFPRGNTIGGHPEPIWAGLGIRGEVELEFDETATSVVWKVDARPAGGTDWRPFGEGRADVRRIMNSQMPPLVTIVANDIRFVFSTRGAYVVRLSISGIPVAERHIWAGDEPA